MPSDFQDILDKFKVIKELKVGGQKSVFIIQDPEHGKTVLKIGNFTNPQTLERIRREVMILRSLDSKYYPKVFKFSIIGKDRFLILEEFVECIPLSECLDSYTDLKKALELLYEIIIGLNIIWEKQVVHRDIKPDNILITNSGSPKIIDLGIARLLDQESITQTFAPRGPSTPIYAAPEQLQNKKTLIDFRTDQFNLGILLLQLLLGGEHPFNPAICNSGINIGENIINGNWCRDRIESNIYKPIKPFVYRLLGREPYMRYRTADLLISAINNCLSEV